MTNAEYWKQRFTQLEAAQNRKGATAYLEMEKQYKAAQNELEAQIARWYQRFADSNGISLAQAKQWLKGQDLAEFKWDVKEYIKYGKENAINSAWMQELENASSKFHISRLEALQIQTQNSLETMFAQQMGTMKKALSDVYASGYYHTAYTVQQGFGLGWDIAGLDQAQIEKVLSKPWAVDGYNFSTRIWNSKTKLIGEVHNELSKNLLTGADPQKAIDSLAKKMALEIRKAIQSSGDYLGKVWAVIFNMLGIDFYKLPPDEQKILKRILSKSPNIKNSPFNFRRKRK